MITRTIVKLTATVNTFSVKEGKMFVEKWDVPTTDEEKALKHLRKTVESDDLKIVNIVSIDKTERLYGITEEDFLENAIELDPTTRKPL